MSSITTAVATVEIAEMGAMPKHRSQLRTIVHTLVREPVALVGFFIVAGWLLLALLAPILPLEDPNYVQMDRKLQAPSWSHPFGTDDVGRDLVSRVIYAARVSVPAGMLVVAVTVVIGCTVGAIAGFAGGKLDALIMRICDAVLSFPSIILAMAIAAARGGPGLSNAMIAVIIVLWPEYARLMTARHPLYAEADIVIDQLLLGWYGNFSIEAMACGRPVVAFIRDDLPALAGYAPPIRSATPDSIQHVLAELVENVTLRRSLADAGREYVGRVHAPERIAQRLVECYREPRSVH